MALDLADKVQADIVIGTDPDSDRVGIAVRDLNNPIGLFNIHFPRAKIFFNKDLADANRTMATEIEEAKNQFDEISKFQIKGLIEKQLDFFKEQATLKNITIETNLKDAVTVNTNIILTEILVSNLFLNAIRHNVKNGKILLQLTNHELIISNTGSSTAINSETLFNRFSKSNSSQKGNGLGLAIVKKIADQNNWEITYSYINNLHTFLVKF